MNKGFTLIELAVVLIIIGLILIGVLVGQHLVEQARISNTISQLKNYNTSVATFKLKYDQLPGDFSKAHMFGIDKSPSGNLNVAETNFTNFDGNNDGWLQARDHNLYNGEYINFWIHLSNAGLVSGSFLQPSGCRLNCDMVTGKAFPASSVGNGIAAVVASTGYDFVIPGLTYVVGVGTGSLTTLSGAGLGGLQTGLAGNNLTPLQATGIDSKMDDGNPGTGIIMAVGQYGFVLGSNVSFFQGPSDATYHCVTALQDGYNTNSGWGSDESNAPACTLAVSAEVK